MCGISINCVVDIRSDRSDKKSIILVKDIRPTVTYCTENLLTPVYCVGTLHCHYTHKAGHWLSFFFFFIIWSVSKLIKKIKWIPPPNNWDEWRNLPRFSIVFWQRDSIHWSASLLIGYMRWLNKNIPVFLFKRGRSLDRLLSVREWPLMSPNSARSRWSGRIWSICG